MGMFDYIKYEAPCPRCGAMLDDWQSKSGACLMDTLEPWEVTNFYTLCTCGARVECTVDAEVEHIVKKLEITTTFSCTRGMINARNTETRGDSG